MGELSRVEDLLETGTEDTVNPLSRVEAILRGEDIKPLSRIEVLLEEHSGGGKGGGTYNTDEDKIKNDAFMLHKDTNFLFTENGKFEGWDYTRTLLYDWDFKSATPWVDKIEGLTITRYPQTTHEVGVGVTVGKYGGCIYLCPNDIKLYKIGMVLEMDISKMSDFSGYTYPLINLGNYAGDSGSFKYRSDNDIWQARSFSEWLSYSKTNMNFKVFENKTFKMVIYSGNLMEVYADNELVYKGYPPDVKSPGDKKLHIAQDGYNSINEITISGIRIYKINNLDD